MLQNLEVKGEVSNLKYHSSGHVYFTLKDEKSAVKCVMFASYRRTGLNFLMTEGMGITVKGSVDVFERDGTYQIYAKEIKQDGLGSLFEQYEKLKEKLAEQGMFDPIYKQPIPKYAKVLGVVTAPTGAAVRDIIDVSKRRNPGIQIVLFPAIVQGDEAPLSVVEGIKSLEAYGVDIIIVGRGGGSIEDLWGFNDERVAQAIFDCKVPIISAVGHETDFTIADFVSDLRAPTPSAAAELAVSDVSYMLRMINDYKARLNQNMTRSIRNARIESSHFSERLSLLNPKNKVIENRKRLEQIKENLNKNINNKIILNKHRLEICARSLHGLSPLVKLSSGFSYVSDENHKNIKSITDVSVNDLIHINVTDGVVEATVNDIKENLWQKN